MLQDVKTWVGQAGNAAPGPPGGPRGPIITTCSSSHVPQRGERHEPRIVPLVNGHPVGAAYGGLDAGGLDAGDQMDTTE